MRKRDSGGRRGPNVIGKRSYISGNGEDEGIFRARGLS